jgi:signal transduction histidine kinase
LVQTHKLKAIGTLTAGVAHELNNPINNIMLIAARLQEDFADLPDDEKMGMAGDLVSESERARTIVRNLLDFARESESEQQALDIPKIISDTLLLASNQARLAGVKIRTETAKALPAVHGDSGQLTQVFLNLVLNALDAMPTGGTLTIAVRPALDGDELEVDFTDTGIGIPEQHISSVFDPFFTSKKKAKGTGLGLSVSLGIIKQHGGDIRVRSRVGEGTTFTVSLPTAMVPASITA